VDRARGQVVDVPLVARGRNVHHAASRVVEVLGPQPKAEPKDDEHPQRPGQPGPADPTVDRLGQRAVELLEHPASPRATRSTPLCRTGRDVLAPYRYVTRERRQEAFRVLDAIRTKCETSGHRRMVCAT